MAWWIFSEHAHVPSTWMKKDSITSTFSCHAPITSPSECPPPPPSIALLCVTPPVFNTMHIKWYQVIYIAHNLVSGFFPPDYDWDPIHVAASSYSVFIFIHVEYFIVWICSNFTNSVIDDGFRLFLDFGYYKWCCCKHSHIAIMFLLSTETCI